MKASELSVKSTMHFLVPVTPPTMELLQFYLARLANIILQMISQKKKNANIN